MVEQRNLADMPGLQLTIQEVVRAFRQAVNAPASAVAVDMVVTLPIPSWAEAGYADNGTANLSAGQSTAISLLQVPGDERAYLDGIWCSRTGGDNTVRELIVTQPPNYGSGSRALTIVRLNAPGTSIYWPLGESDQNIVYGMPMGPLLMEPLAIVGLLPEGAGVAATTYDYQISRRRMKLHRAQAPGI